MIVEHRLQGGGVEDAVAPAFDLLNGGGMDAFMGGGVWRAKASGNQTLQKRCFPFDFALDLALLLPLLGLFDNAFCQHGLDLQ